DHVLRIVRHLEVLDEFDLPRCDRTSDTGAEIGFHEHRVNFMRYDWHSLSPVKEASYYGSAGKSRRRRRGRSDALQVLDAIMRQCGLVHIQAQTGILRHDAFAIGELEGLLAVQQRQK